MSATQQEIMTVLGPIPAEQAGPTLPHEHLLIDITCYWQQPAEMTMRRFAHEPVQLSNLGMIRRNPLANLDNCQLDDLDLAINEIGAFAALGGTTIVEVTPPDIGRDLPALQIAARQSGLNIVAGCGHYVHLAHPPSLAEEPVEAVAERLVTELQEGTGTTKVRPGIIGELGTSDPIRPDEEKVLRAAAIAQQQTGVAITTHLHPASRTGHEVFRILDDAGADPTRIVFGHVDFALGHLDMTVGEAVKYHSSLADYGSYIQYDGVGNEAYFEGAGYGESFWCPSDRVRAEAVKRLIDLGYGDRILLSHDVCHKYHLLRYGGFGYGHILRTFVKNLRDFGLEDAVIQRIIVENPRRMLAVPTTSM